MTASNELESDDILTDLLVGLERDASGARARAALRFPSNWGQGRAIFGGLQAGLGLRAMATLLPEDPVVGPGARRARSLQVGFVGPLEAEVEAEVEVELLRHGRSASVMRAQISQGGTVRTTLLGCFAAARESTIDLQVWPRPHMRGPEGLTGMSIAAAKLPAFYSHFEQRWVTRDSPGRAPDVGAFAGWGRFRERIIAPGPAAIAGLVDAWPTPLLLASSEPVPASSLTWSIDFVDVDDAAAVDQWWAYTVETDRASGGWVHTHARLWSPNGKLVATSLQTIALFA